MSPAGEKLSMRRAFTILEVLITVAVIGILAAIVIINFGDAGKDARRGVATSFEKALENGVAMYISQLGHIPSGFYGWVALSPGGSQMNLVRIDAPLRSELADHDQQVMSGNSNRIQLVFPGNMTATYDIDLSGKVTMTLSE